MAYLSARSRVQACVAKALSALPQEARLVTASGTTRHERFGQIIARPLAQLHARMAERELDHAFLLTGTEPGRDALAAKLREGGLPVAHLPAVSGAIRQAVFRRSALHLAYCEPDCEEPRLAEAMTCGCLVAASDTPYPRTLIRQRRRHRPAQILDAAMLPPLRPLARARRRSIRAKRGWAKQAR